MTSRSAKNILLVGNWSSDTGYAWKMIERFWIAIAQSFPDRRSFLCFPKVRTVNPEIRAAGIEVEEFAFDFRHPDTLAQFCHDRDIALIYRTGRPYTSRVSSRLRRSGVRRIVAHDHTPGQRTRPSALKGLLQKIDAHAFGTDAYIACSEQVLDRFENVGCLPRARRHLARNGIDISQFPQLNPRIRAALSLSTDTVLAVSCSSLHPYNRVHDVVDAAALLGDLYVHFVHIGDGSNYGPLQSRIRERGLDMRFTLLGRRRDVAQVHSGCDIAVHASSGEGLCLAILEFLATGLALGGADEPSVSRLIDTGITGLTFAHANVTSLA